MSLVCNVCEKKATQRVVIELGRFSHRFYYCDGHKPLSFKLEKMDEKQSDEGKIIRQELFAEDNVPVQEKKK